MYKSPKGPRHFTVKRREIETANSGGAGTPGKHWVSLLVHNPKRLSKYPKKDS